ncbi:MAG: UTP--glucose-1-phosphate uridylyltransferase GalU [Deltaproteobacteria bacterium]|nr:UTP--glucose-1-phosphate uridylyltransferase GalU [Deltaproteobacteria bacterium]
MVSGKVKKAVIPAAGLGTRFLPATKSVPKELLPIVDRPTIEYIVDEVHQSGIETAIIISRRGKSAILDHFERDVDLENKLKKEGKFELARRLNEQSELITIVSVRQSVPLGLGQAVYTARSLVGDEPFAVLLGDDIFDSSLPATLQLIQVFEKFQKPVVALMTVESSDISKFGCAGGEFIEENILEINSIIEKPSVEEAPSNFAVVGRYVLTPTVFEILKDLPPGKGGEIQLTDALAKLIEQEGLLGYFVDGYRFDAGDQLGFLMANIHFGLKNEKLKDRLIAFLKDEIKSS